MGKIEGQIMLKEQPVRWYPDTASRFLELLRDLSWNAAVRALRAEMKEGERKTA